MHIDAEQRAYNPSLYLVGKICHKIKVARGGEEACRETHNMTDMICDHPLICPTKDIVAI